jgi:hypothetical protein
MKPAPPLVLLENVPQFRTNTGNLPYTIRTSGAAHHFQHDG